jgi:hypothetical protein
MGLNQSIHQPTSPLCPSTTTHSTAQHRLASVADQWGPRATSPFSPESTRTRIVSLIDGPPCEPRASHVLLTCVWASDVSRRPQMGYRSRLNERT